MTEYVMILGDSARGIYMPKLARDLMDAGWRGITEEQCTIIEKALGDGGHETDENDQLGDVWTEILDNAEYTDAHGDNWILSQDGDLFAYNSTKIAQIEQSLIEVCADCRHYLLCGDHLDPDTLDAERIEQAAEKFFGISEIPEEIQGFNDDLDPHDEFSARQCDCCGTRLAGDRYKLVEHAKE